MSAHFPQTLRSLGAGRSARKTLTIVAALLLAVAWTVWFVAAPIDVYAVTPQARLEAAGLARPVMPLIDGQVLENSLQLGQAVEAGQVLLVLDDREQRLALETGRRRLAALQTLVESFEQEIAAEQRAQAEAETAATATEAEQVRRTDEAIAEAAFQQKRLKRIGQLRDRSAATADQYEQAENDAERARLAVLVLESGLERIRTSRVVDQADRLSRIAKVRRERDEFSAQVAEQQARLSELEHDVERCRIRAVCAGRVGQLGNYPPGCRLSAGEIVAAVVPDDAPRAVAFFSTTHAGRIRAGQPARLRLEGFPWTQYGSVAARVSHVASEPHAGTFRVELVLESPATEHLPIPIEHGLPASAEVRVERVSPAVLLLRILGRWLTPAAIPRSSA
jgi:membrane fusion protein (multidrug efflux system)